MATSGQLATSLHYGQPAFVRVKWTQVSQSIPNTSTTIKVDVYGVMGQTATTETVEFGPMQIMVAGKKLIDITSKQKETFKGEVLLQSRQIEIKHNYDGTKTFTISAKVGVNSKTFNSEGSCNFTLEPLVTVSEITGKTSCYVGNTLDLIIKSKDSRFTHTVEWIIPTDYKTRDFIAVKTKEPIVRWKVPLNFTQYMNGKSTIEVLIKCYTYLYEELVGSTPFYVNISKIGTKGGPIITAKWADANPTTSRLTGSNNFIIPGYSNIDVAGTTATSRNPNATVESVYVKNNGYIMQIGDTNHMLNKIKDPVLIFSARDTKDGYTEEVVTLKKVPYSKPTCSVTVSPNANNLEVSAEGTYFLGDFGAHLNDLVIYWAYSIDGGPWQREERLYPDTAAGGKWRATRTISNPNYKSSYRVRIHLWDALEDLYFYSDSSKANTIFDWSPNDFNFNVPVYIMGKQVIPGEGGGGEKPTPTPPPTPPEPKPIEKGMFYMGPLPTTTTDGGAECVVVPELGLGFIRGYFKNKNKIPKGSTAIFTGMPSGYRPQNNTALAYHGIPNATMRVTTDGDIILTAHEDINAGYALYCSGVIRYLSSSSYPSVRSASEGVVIDGN